MPRWIYSGDAVSIRTSTICLITTGDMSVPADHASTFGERGQYFFENSSTGRWHSKYGIANTLLYLPPLIAEYAWTSRLPFFDDLDSESLVCRCVVLNVYNILLSLLLALYLFRFARLYATSARDAAMFVAVAFFGTFLWNYLRAQTVEIFQVLFFTAACFHLLQYRRQLKKGGRTSSHAFLAMLFLGLLALGKLIYILLLPLAICYLFCAGRERNRDMSRHSDLAGRMWITRKQFAAHAILPAVVICGLILFSNWWRFSDPLETGYGQWDREQVFLSWNVFPGMYGFLFDARTSVLMYFPLLPISLIGLRAFAQQHRLEVLFVACVFLVFYVANSAFINWRGGWCYGPRYLLFVLPVMSLPCVEIMNRGHKSRSWRSAIILTLIAIAVWTFATQSWVHGFEFHAPFRAESELQDSKSDRVDEYFRQPLWVINRDLLRTKTGREVFPPLEHLRGRLSEDAFQQKQDALNRLVVFNLFWLNLPDSGTSPPPDQARP